MPYTLQVFPKSYHCNSTFAWRIFQDIQRIKLNSGNAQVQTDGVIIVMMQTKKSLFLCCPFSLVGFQQERGSWQHYQTVANVSSSIRVQRKSIFCTQRLKRRWPYTDLYQRRYMALQHVGHSNTLCAHLTRLITNHAPTGEYRRRFFPHEENTSPNMNACLCGLADLETWDHILYECRRFKGESKFDIIRFSEENHDPFCFQLVSCICSYSIVYTSLFLFLPVSAPISSLVSVFK